MSWHGPSAPRVEGIATKSRVVLSWASKPASTASRIRLVSLAFMMVIVPLRSTRSDHSPRRMSMRIQNRRPIPCEVGETGACPCHDDHRTDSRLLSALGGDDDGGAGIE